MKKERKTISVSLIDANVGQLDWLPKNPRQWTQGDIDRTAKSIQEDTDFLEDRPLLLVPVIADWAKAERYVVFAGNLRREGALATKLATVSAVVYHPETDEDFETVKRRAMKDNGSFGSWDFDELANNWDDLPLVDWGVPAWEGKKEDEMPTDLDAEPKEKPFVLKITFPDAEKMTAFVMAYKDTLESDYGCTMSESGGAL